MGALKHGATTYHAMASLYVGISGSEEDTDFSLSTSQQLQIDASTTEPCLNLGRVANNDMRFSMTGISSLEPH